VIVVTDHKELQSGGVPVHEILRTDLSRLVDDVLRRLVADIPLYAQLPDEELQGDIRRVTERTLRAFADTFRTGDVPAGEALDPLRESATRRAEEGVPLEALLAAYHLGGRVCADHVAARFRPDELQDAIALNRLILDFLQRVTAVVSASYFEERQSIAGEDLATRQSVLAALVDGRPVDESAGLAGVRLPAEYVVLGLAIGPHPDEHRPGVDPQIVARRKLRRIRVELDRVPGSMSALSPDGGIALLPIPSLPTPEPAPRTGNTPGGETRGDPRIGSPAGVQTPSGSGSRTATAGGLGGETGVRVGGGFGREARAETGGGLGGEAGVGVRGGFAREARAGTDGGLGGQARGGVGGGVGGAGGVAGLWGRLGRGAGVEVTVAVARVVPGEVPAGVGLVRELLEVVRVHRRPAGVYELDDLLLEYQLSRPGPARERLAGMLVPLAERDDLMATLRCYLGNARDRRRTAADLHVHANTVDYRLRQVGRLTGLDPTRDDQLPRIVAALVAFDARRSPG
jgi:hypothetical protein